MTSMVILPFGGYLVKGINLLNVNIRNTPKIKAKKCVSARSVGLVSYKVSRSLCLVISANETEATFPGGSEKMFSLPRATVARLSHAPV